jgi:DNA-binding NtrC family response regulator
MSSSASPIEMLNSMGYLATAAPNARTALSILVSEPIDILLADIGLPDMSGTTLAEFAKSRIPSLTVIFTSGQAPDANVPANLAFRILLKPFSFDALLAVIASVEKTDRTAG